MERARRLAAVAVGLAVMLLTTGLVLRLAGDDADRVEAAAPPSSIDLGTDLASQDQPPLPALEPVAPAPFDPGVPPGLDPQPVPMPVPVPGVATIPLPDLSTGVTTGPGATTTPKGPAFTQPGVWVVKADGTSPILVAGSATAGVAAGGTWVAFVEGSTVRAVKRSDLRTKIDLADGVSGGAAQGLPISGGQRGVAFLRAGRAVLVDPASPDQPVASFEAPGADAVAAEEDGAGRLVWADGDGLHLGTPESSAPGDDVQRGILGVGHGILAHLQDGRIVVRNGPALAWGEVDRLHLGPAGMVAGSGGKVRFRSRAGEDRVVLERATTPVVSTSRILYVSGNQALASASLSGTGTTTVATASAGRTITNLDLLDDSTVVVTVT